MAGQSGDGPADPISDLAAAAAQLHELYTSYRSAGFTNEQAMYVVACVACGGPKPPQETS